MSVSGIYVLNHSFYEKINKSENLFNLITNHFKKNEILKKSDFQNFINNIIFDNVFKIGCSNDLIKRVKSSDYRVMFLPEDIPNVVRKYVFPKFENFKDIKYFESIIHHFLKENRISDRRELFSKVDLYKLDVFASILTVNFENNEEFFQNDEESFQDKYFENDEEAFEDKSFEEITYDLKDLKPQQFQIEILEKMNVYYEKENLGKLNLACGTGKSYISLFYILNKGFNTSLILVSSIELLKQFKNISKQICKNYSIFEISGEKNDYKKYSDEVDKNYDKHKKIVIATYHSAKIMEEFIFDFVIFDEAHRTVNNCEKEDALFKNNLAYFCPYFIEDKIYNKCLFLTATEKNKFYKDGVKKYSMDNSEIYGKTICTLNFAQAIEKNLICDYKIFICLNYEEEYFDKIDLNELEKYYFDKAQNIKSILKKFHVNKLLVYCRRVKDCERICELLKNNDFNTYHVHGGLSFEERKSILEKFKNSERAVILNCKFFSEGISINCIDSVYFADSKFSDIDITQSIGRALRKDNENPYKIASIFVNEDMIKEEDFLKTMVKMDDNFKSNYKKKVFYINNYEKFDLLKIKEKINSLEISMKFQILERKNYTFSNNIELILNYEKTFGKVLTTNTLYQKAKIGSFYNNCKTKYKKNRLSFEKIELLKTTESFYQWLKLRETKITFSFKEKIQLILDYEKIFGKNLTSETNYENAKIGSFFANYKTKYNQNKLSFEKLEWLKKNKIF